MNKSDSNVKQRKKFRRSLKKELKNRGLWDKQKLDILICCRCKREFPLNTNKNNLPLYTEEVRKNWICPICK